MSFVIRRAGPQDAEEIVGVSAARYIGNDGNTPETGFTIRIPEVWQVKLSDGYVAVTDGKIVGYKLDYSPEADRESFGKNGLEGAWAGVAELERPWLDAYQMAVLREYEKRGIGKALWDVSERDARVKNYGRFYGEIMSHPPNSLSQDFHARRGLKKMAERTQKHFLLKDMTYFDARFGLYVKEILPAALLHGVQAGSGVART